VFSGIPCDLQWQTIHRLLTLTQPPSRSSRSFSPLAIPLAQSPRQTSVETCYEKPPHQSHTPTIVNQSHIANHLSHHYHQRRFPRPPHRPPLPRHQISSIHIAAKSNVRRARQRPRTSRHYSFVGRKFVPTLRRSPDQSTSLEPSPLYTS